MKYKTKTIMWEDNNEPPKNYIWAKPDGKFYEYSYVTRNWVESKLIKSEKSGGSDGSGSNSDIFFVPATIQPKYFVNNDGTEPIEIKNYTPAEYTVFLYNKEDLISLGAIEKDLNRLEYTGINDAYSDVYDNDGRNGYKMPKSVFREKIILKNFDIEEFAIGVYGVRGCCIYKIADDVFIMIESNDFN